MPLELLALGPLVQAVAHGDDHRRDRHLHVRNHEAATQDATWRRDGPVMATVNARDQRSGPLQGPTIMKLGAAARRLEATARARPGEPRAATAALAPLREGVPTLAHTYDTYLRYTDGGPDALVEETNSGLGQRSAALLAGRRSLESRARALDAACRAPA